MKLRLRRFANRLRELREHAGMSQKQLARDSRLPLMTIAYLEQGELAPSWFDVLVISKALGVDCMAFAPEAATAKKPTAPPATPPATDSQAEAKRPHKAKPTRRGEKA